ncbi:MAG: glycosyltransferase family 2 protein [Cocleimonas sp.]|nr:glycosyltransferase family 2 protein [Cocleimonas sp.]
METLEYTYKIKPNNYFPRNNCLLGILLFFSKKECKLLGQTLLSIDNQTCPQWKLIIVVPDNNFLGLYTLVPILDKSDIKPYSIITSILPPHKIAQQVQEKHIALITSGDVLDKNFVCSFFKHRQKNPLLRFFYSDHQLLNTNKQPVTHFKPDWNPDYLKSYNYLSRAVIFYRQDLINLTELTTDEKLSNQQDYFHWLILHVTQHYRDEEIYHCAMVLFYLNEVRSNEPSLTPLADYFITDDTIHSRPSKIGKQKLPPTDNPLVSIIIPTKNQAELLRQCINSLLDNTLYSVIELLVIDNQSDEPTALAYLEQLSHKDNIRILHYPHPFNYSAINNFAVKQANGSLIALVNNDIEVINPEWLSEMVAQACRPEIGCVGAKLYYPDGTIQHGGVILGIRGTASHAHKYFSGDHTGYFNRLAVAHNVSAVTAACLVMRKEVFEEVNGFDEVNLKVAYNDVDLCLKVLARGYRNLWTPHAELIHYESKSRGKKRSWWQRRKLRKEARFLQKKWGKLLLNDPCYNPNLTLDCEDFSIKKKND